MGLHSWPCVHSYSLGVFAPLVRSIYSEPVCVSLCLLVRRIRRRRYSPTPLRTCSTHAIVLLWKMVFPGLSQKQNPTIIALGKSKYGRGGSRWDHAAGTLTSFHSGVNSPCESDKATGVASQFGQDLPKKKGGHFVTPDLPIFMTSPRPTFMTGLLWRAASTPISGSFSVGRLLVD